MTASPMPADRSHATPSVGLRATSNTLGLPPALASVEPTYCIRPRSVSTTCAAETGAAGAGSMAATSL
jgi:hypothetical protein